MAIRLDEAQVLHGEAGRHVITLPCCRQTVFLQLREPDPTCTSCNRPIEHEEDVYCVTVPVCAECYRR